MTLLPGTCNVQEKTYVFLLLLLLFFFFFFFFFFFNLTYSRWTSSSPSCLWSLRILPYLPGSRLTIFYRDASSALLQLVNQWLNFTYSRSHAFRYKRKNTNPTLVRIELTTSALADIFRSIILLGHNPDFEVTVTPLCMSHKGMIYELGGNEQVRSKSILVIFLVAQLFPWRTK